MILDNTRRKVRKYLQERYDSSGKSDLERYYGEQMAYGHREILLEYLGASRDYYFKAALTHGKLLPDRFDPITPLFRRDGSQILHALWRSDGEVEAAKKGVKAISIGATGLYALNNLGQAITETRRNLVSFAKKHTWSSDTKAAADLLKDKRVLYMPQHSWDGEVVNHKNSDVGILNLLNPAKVTVLLAYLDFLDFENRGYYESLGFKVECAGIRASKVFASPAGGREKFLYTLFDIISRNDAVVSNSLTTGLFYAACLEKKIGILPGVGIQEFVFSKWRNSEEFKLDIEEQKSFFRWLTDSDSCSAEDIYSDISDAIGLNMFKSPTQIKETIELIRDEV